MHDSGISSDRATKNVLWVLQINHSDRLVFSANTNVAIRLERQRDERNILLFDAERAQLRN